MGGVSGGIPGGERGGGCGGLRVVGWSWEVES